jgi:hypothetical protein
MMNRIAGLGLICDDERSFSGAAEAGTLVNREEVSMATLLSDEQIRSRFVTLRDKWKRESRYLSNTAQMAMLWPYQQVIGIGMDAVPLILAELEREPDHWFWALEAITGENPVSADALGDVEASAQAWIDWGRQQGLIQ